MAPIDDTVKKVTNSLETLSDEVEKEVDDYAKDRVRRVLADAEQFLRTWEDRPTPHTTSDVIAVANMILLEANRMDGDMKL